MAITLEIEHDDDDEDGLMNECKGKNEETLFLNSFDSSEGGSVNTKWHDFFIVIRSHLSTIASKFYLPPLLVLVLPPFSLAQTIGSSVSWPWKGGRYVYARR